MSSLRYRTSSLWLMILALLWVGMPVGANRNNSEPCLDPSKARRNLRYIRIPSSGREVPLKALTTYRFSVSFISWVYKYILQDSMGIAVDVEEVEAMRDSERGRILAGCLPDGVDRDNLPKPLPGIPEGCTRDIFEDPLGHVSLESWGVYNSISKEFPDDPPILARVLPYQGETGLWVRRSFVDKALAQSGLSPEFYRSWNMSWFDWSPYFDSVATIRARADELGYSRDAEPMTKGTEYLKIVGKSYLEHVPDPEMFEDPSAEVLIPKTYRGNWVPTLPCRQLMLARGDTEFTMEGCIPVIDKLPNLWGMLHGFQWAYFFNIPLVIGMYSFEDYVQIGKNLDVILYNWFPDPAVNGFVKIFLTPENKTETVMNKFASGRNSVPIEHIAWDKLKEISFSAFRLARGWNMREAEVQEMMVELGKTRQTDEDMKRVACDWVRSNEHRWRSWLPLYGDCRRNEEHVWEDPNCREDYSTCEFNCQQCPDGFYSSLNINTNIRVCIPCPAGSFCVIGLEPVVCPAGAMCPEKSSDFISCPLGSYQPEVGKSFCLSCPYTHTSTPFTGAKKRADCSCQPGFYRICATEECTVEGELVVESSKGMSAAVAIAEERIGSFCTPCEPKSGLICPGGHVAKSGVMNPPQLLPNFMTQVNSTFLGGASGLEVFRCRSKIQCPGGDLGTCGSLMLNDFAGCARCEEGYYMSSFQCESCASSDSPLQVRLKSPHPSFLFAAQALWIVVIVAIFVAVLLVILCTANNPVSAELSVTLLVSLSVGSMIFAIQSIAVLDKISVNWPPSLERVLNLAELLIFDLSSLKAICSMITSPVNDFMLRTLLPLTIPGVYCVIYLLLLSCPECSLAKSVSFNKLINSTGYIFQGIYTSLVLNSVAPFQCYSHPNGKSSVYLYPSVLCGSSEHGVLVTFGVFGIIVYGVGFFSLSLYACIVAPRLTAKNSRFMSKFRFLFFRFRPDRWYWSVIMLLRNGLLAICPILDPNDSRLQLLSMTLVMAFGLAAQAIFWPWKSVTINCLDFIVCSCLLVIIAGAGALTGDAQQASQEGYEVLIFLMLCAIVVSLIVMVVYGAYMARPCCCRRFHRRVLEKNREQRELLLVRWFAMCRLMTSWSDGQQETYIKSLTDFDSRVLERSMSTLVNVRVSLRGLNKDHTGGLRRRLAPEEDVSENNFSGKIVPE